MVFIDLARNIALVLALCVGCSVIYRRWDSRSLRSRLTAGLVFGVAAVVGMMTPVTLSPGVIFDGRSILVSMGGLIGGALPGLIAGMMAAVCRLWLGGSGALTGCGVILTSALLGIGYHSLRRRDAWHRIRSLHLLLFGLTVHVAMLLWMLTLPAEIRWTVLRTITPSVLVLYPLGTVLVGRLLASQIAGADAERQLLASERRYQAIAEDTPVMLCRFLPNGRITYVNRAYGDCFGHDPSDLVGESFLDLIPAEDRESVMGGIQRLSAGAPTQTHEHRVMLPHGEAGWQRWTNRALFDSDGKVHTYQSIGEDITAWKRTEKERETTIAVLEVLNEETGLHELMESLQLLLRKLADCEAVGIRLRDGDDYPYYVTAGFPPCFVQAENSLCTRDLDGQLVRDELGNPVLECMCGNIICNRVEPSLPFYTNYGSFVSNGTTKLLASTTEEDRQARTRNRCNGEGYESVFLVPLRASGETFGLLQLNDPSEDKFPPSLVAQVERVAGDIAIALAQRKAEAEVLRQNQLLDALLEHIPHDFFVKDRQSRFLLACRKILDHVGLSSQEDMAGLTDFDINPREEAERQFKQEQDLMASGEAMVGVEVEGYHPEGPSTWYLSTKVPFRGEQGEVVGLVGMNQSITEQKAAEQTLRRSEQRFRKLAELLPEGVFETDAARNLVFLNRRAQALFGISMEDLNQGVGYLDLFPESEREQAAADAEKRAGGTLSGGIEYTGQRGDGTTFPILLSMDPVYDGDTLSGFSGIIIEMTARKEAEAERERLMAAIGQAAESVVITDTAGTIQYVNPAFVAASGYSCSEALGQNPRILKSDRHDAGFYEQMWATLTSGETWSGRLVNRKKDGTLFTEEAVISPVRDRSGKTVNYVGVKRDVTHEVELEESLRQSQKMEAIGTLAGGIAHDFNNLLYAIEGFSEMASLRIDDDSPAQEMLREVRQSSRRAADLVSQILHISRRREKEHGPIWLHTVLKEAMTMLRGSLPSTIRITQVIDENCGAVMADSTEVYQVVLNLCVNAFHAMRAAGGELTVSLERVHVSEEDASVRTDLEPVDYVCLTVKDTGCGIEESILGRVFEPYFTTKPQGEGTGLGLSTVHGIMRSYGGAVTVESVAGTGSTFALYFPSTSSVDAAGDKKTPPETARGRGERILAVDDEATLARLYGFSLDHLGYRAETFTDAVEALEAFRAEPDGYDLVVTDQTMPRMTGTQLSKELLALRPDLPIVLCTGYSDLVNHEMAMKMGIGAFLKKPIQGHELANTVHGLLNRSTE